VAKAALDAPKNSHNIGGRFEADVHVTVSAGNVSCMSDPCALPSCLLPLSVVDH